MSNADTLRARGNALYQEGRFEDARAVYADAINVLLAASAAGDRAQGERIAQLYSNRAQTFVQERNFALALQDAVRALEFDPQNEKAQLRRLVALENLERFETAFRLVERLLDDMETRKKHPALFEYAVTARRRLRKNIQQDKAAAQHESHAIGRMVHDNQKLRINFGCLIPSRVPFGAFFDVAVNIGNEFGLFRRDYLAEGERIKLQCVLRNNADSSLRLVFREASSAASASTLDASEHTTPVDGVATLNDRGKALFQLAIEPTDDTHEPQQRSNMALALSVHGESAVKWNLLPIVSLPFSLTTERDTCEEIAVDEGAASASLGIHCCRPVWLPTLGRELLLAESPGNLGIGGKLWDSCLVLTRYLARHKHELTGKSVVELGSGLGLVGMFCALLGARHVTLTDIDEVVPLLAYNIRLNLAGEAAAPSLVAVPHFWGSSTESLPERRPDVLVLSDIVYDPEGYAPLVASLNALASSPETTIFMAHRSRNPMEHQFFEQLARTFAYELVDWAVEERAHQDDGGDQAATTMGAARSRLDQGDAPRKDERVLQDVKIFRISRRA